MRKWLNYLPLCLFFSKVYAAHIQEFKNSVYLLDSCTKACPLRNSEYSTFSRLNDLPTSDIKVTENLQQSTLSNLQNNLHNDQVLESSIQSFSKLHRRGLLSKKTKFHIKQPTFNRKEPNPVPASEIKIAILGLGIDTSDPIFGCSSKRIFSTHEKCKIRKIYDCTAPLVREGVSQESNNVVCASISHLSAKNVPIHNEASVAKTILEMTADSSGVDSKLSFYDFRISEERPQSIYQALSKAASEKVHIIYLPINKNLEFHFYDAIQRLNQRQRFVDKDTGNEILMTASASSDNSQPAFTVSLLGLLSNVFIVGSMSVAHSSFSSVIYFEEGEDIPYHVKYLTRKVLFRRSPTPLKAAAIFPDESFSGSLKDEKLVFFFCETKKDCLDTLTLLQGKFTSAVMLVSKEDLSDLQTQFFQNDVPIGVLNKKNYDTLYEKLYKVKKIKIHMENRKTDPTQLEEAKFYPSTFSANGPSGKLQIKPDFLVSSYPLKEKERGFSKLYDLYEPRAISNTRFASVLAAYVDACMQRKQKIRHVDALQLAQVTAKPFIFTDKQLQTLGLTNEVAPSYLGWATPVTLQGAGMLNAEEFLKNPSIAIAPGKLELGDFSSEKVKEVVIENTSSKDMDYELEHIPALTYHQPKPLDSLPSLQTMSIELKWKKSWIQLYRRFRSKSQVVHSNRIRVGKHSKVTITLKFSVPSNTKQFAFFNGYIRFKPVPELESNAEYGFVPNLDRNNPLERHLPYFGVYKGFYSFPYIETMPNTDQVQTLPIDHGLLLNDPIVLENIGEVNPHIQFRLTIPSKKLHLFLMVDGNKDRTLPMLAEYKYLKPGVYTFPSNSKEPVQSTRGYECGWTSLLNPGKWKEPILKTKSKTNAKYQLCIKATFWDPIEFQRSFKNKVDDFFQKRKGIEIQTPQVFCSQPFQISECSKET